MPLRIGYVLLIALISLSFVQSAKPQERLSIELANVRWQQPPKEVRAAYVGPDGRTWYQLSSDPGGKSPEDVRRSLEREYRQTAPQVSGAAIALLEPTGRAWFSWNYGKELWGYDGRQWIQRDAPDGSTFIGVCPTRGALPDNVSNRFVGGKAWFRDRQGVHVFDGNEWSYAPFFDRASDRRFEPPRFAASPDGELAVALVAETNEENSVTRHDVWVFQNGKWQQRGHLPAPRRGSAGSFCITNEGILWYVWNSVALRSLDLSEKSTAAQEDLAPLIAQLGHKQFERREEATEKLAKEGADIAPQLKGALEGAKDVEIKLRLEELLNRFDNQFTRPIEEFAVFGDCRVQKVAAIFQDEDERLYVFSEAIQRDGKPVTCGLAMIGTDGQVDVHPLPNGPEGLRGIGYSHSAPIQTARGQILLLPRFRYETPVRSVDYRIGRLLAYEVPDARFGYVQAVDDEERIWVSDAPPNRTWVHGNSLAVLDLDAVDNRTTLDASAFEVGRHAFLVATDGSLWANWRDSLSRFDGRSWETLHPVDSDDSVSLLAGRNGVVLAQLNQLNLLFQGSRAVDHGSLQELIERQKPLIADAFSPRGAPPGGRNVNMSVTADSKGNIWLRQSNQLSVLSGDKWIEHSGIASFLSAVGDGSKVYFSALSLDRGNSFFAEIRDGKLQVARAPQAAHQHEAPTGLRDGEGALWIPRYIGSSHRITGQVATRLGPQGTLQEVENYWPLLLDRSGNVWLTKVRPPQSNRLRVWRAGKVVQELEVPGANSVYFLFSDKPGSVYAWTPLGLQHFAADDTPEGYRYRFDTTYATPRIPGTDGQGHWGSTSAHSDLGYFVVGVTMQYPGRLPQQQLRLIRLPK